MAKIWLRYQKAPLSSQAYLTISCVPSPIPPKMIMLYAIKVHIRIHSLVFYLFHFDFNVKTGKGKCRTNYYFHKIAINYVKKLIKMIHIYFHLHYNAKSFSIISIVVTLSIVYICQGIKSDYFSSSYCFFFLNKIFFLVKIIFLFSINLQF